jgi:hypothetical protein
MQEYFALPHHEDRNGEVPAGSIGAHTALGYSTYVMKFSRRRMAVGLWVPSVRRMLFDHAQYHPYCLLPTPLPLNPDNDDTLVVSTKGYLGYINSRIPIRQAWVRIFAGRLRSTVMGHIQINAFVKRTMLLLEAES